MADLRAQQSLLEDLEAIRKGLDKVEGSASTIPTLEEIVGHRGPATVNLDNPFLSSSSLSELIKIRNDAESRAAQELSKLKPVMTLDQIQAANASSTLVAEPTPQAEPEPEPEPIPDPNLIISQMEQLFDSWIENSVAQYMVLFEGELRNRLQQDFRDLVTRWYLEQGLAVPASFLDQTTSEVVPEATPKTMPEATPEATPETTPKTVPDDTPPAP
ncbi:hypothetical protein [Reinekea sp.]|jgi:hypothetical protein|uniref:hypothetical protein n=1 Tax=Reinekea sp. TaxID=1970455 RepID=UPI002A819746|nr:hypothetical protein [Reinekea sp.]